MQLYVHCWKVWWHRKFHSQRKRAKTEEYHFICFLIALYASIDSSFASKHVEIINNLMISPNWLLKWWRHHAKKLWWCAWNRCIRQQNVAKIREYKESCREQIAMNIFSDDADEEDVSVYITCFAYKFTFNIISKCYCLYHSYFKWTKHSNVFDTIQIVHQNQTMIERIINT